jgi:hypothetical protein
MTPGEFKKLASRIPGVTEGSHQGHTDFRVKGRIFATLGYPDDSWGMVKLSPTDQALYLERYPESFVPAAGEWGRRGSTLVRLEAATPKILGAALKFASAHCSSPPKGKRQAPAG